MNQCILVGKVIKISDRDKESRMTIVVGRLTEDDNILNKSDNIEIILSEGIKKEAIKYIATGATVGIKGRVASKTIAIANATYATNEIIAEKITFINSGNKNV